MRPFSRQILQRKHRTYTLNPHGLWSSKSSKLGSKERIEGYMRRGLSDGLMVSMDKINWTDVNGGVSEALDVLLNLT